jgi:hypothetical protein
VRGALRESILRPEGTQIRFHTASGIERPALAGFRMSGLGLSGGGSVWIVVPHAMEPLWQGVEQEAPDELTGRERHRTQPLPAVAAVILVTEGHAARVEADQSAVEMATRWV